MIPSGFLAPKFENFPEDLKALRWAVWIAEPRDGKPGKFNKAPRSPRTGVKVGTNNPTLFGTFDEAKRAYKESAGKYTGVGVLLDGSGVVGIDIDDASATLSSTPELQKWLETAVRLGAYCEVSPSNKGLRLFVRGSIPEGSPAKGDNIEIYAKLRFLTVTGHVIPVAGHE